jgi:hypothetical protein
MPPCSGAIPLQWQNTTRQDVKTVLPGNITDIDLSGNLLSGSLPAIIGGNNVIHTLRNLRLQHNKFTGRVSRLTWRSCLKRMRCAMQHPSLLNGVCREMLCMYCNVHQGDVHASSMNGAVQYGLA